MDVYGLEIIPSRERGAEAPAAVRPSPFRLRNLLLPRSAEGCRASVRRLAAACPPPVSVSPIDGRIGAARRIVGEPVAVVLPRRAGHEPFVSLAPARGEHAEPRVRTLRPEPAAAIDDVHPD